MDIGIHPTVVVMGVSGSGKSTVGLLLAHQLGVPFADADDFHSEQAKAKMAAGHPLDDADRAPWLRRLADWLAEHPDGAVLACSALKRRYRDVLRTGAPKLCLLHLAGDPAVVTERVGHRHQPLHAGLAGGFAVRDAGTAGTGRVRGGAGLHRRPGADRATVPRGGLMNGPLLLAAGTSGSHDTRLIVAALIGIAVIIALITFLKLNPFLSLTAGSVLVGGAGRPGPGQDRDQLRQRGRQHGGQRRHPDRAGCHLRQATGRLRRRRPAGGHHRRTLQRAQPALGDGAGRHDHRPADVLRDRPGAADAGDPAGGPAIRPAADAGRDPGAGRAVGDARVRAAAPRAAGRGRRVARRPRADPGPGRAGRGAVRDHRRPAVLGAGRPLGGRPGAGAVPDRPASRQRAEPGRAAAAGRPAGRPGQAIRTSRPGPDAADRPDAASRDRPRRRDPAAELRRHAGHRAAAGGADAGQGTGRRAGPER